MSDFSALEQSFGLMPATMTSDFFEVPLSPDVQPHELGFRMLRGANEIGRIMHLRNELTLPTAALRAPGFAVREKKETRSGWWAPSCAAANTSAPSDCCR